MSQADEDFGRNYYREDDDFCDYGPAPKGPVGFVWCKEHQRMETDWQALNEITQNYLRAHPDAIEAIFEVP